MLTQKTKLKLDEYIKEALDNRENNRRSHTNLWDANIYEAVSGGWWGLSLRTHYLPTGGQTIMMLTKRDALAGAHYFKMHRPTHLKWNKGKDGFWVATLHSNIKAWVCLPGRHITMGVPKVNIYDSIPLPKKLIGNQLFLLVEEKITKRLEDAAEQKQKESHKIYAEAEKLKNMRYVAGYAMQG